MCSTKFASNKNIAEGNYFNLKSKGAIADITICERTYMSYDSTLAIYFSFFNSCILLFNDHYYYFVLFFFFQFLFSLFFACSVVC